MLCRGKDQTLMNLIILLVCQHHAVVMLKHHCQILHNLLWTNATKPIYIMSCHNRNHNNRSLYYPRFPSRKKRKTHRSLGIIPNHQFRKKQPRANLLLQSPNHSCSHDSNRHDSTNMSTDPTNGTGRSGIGPIIQRTIDDHGLCAVDSRDIRRSIINLLLYQIVIVLIVAPTGVVFCAHTAHR